MISLVAGKRSEIAALCRSHRVRRLSLTGSATRADFAPGSSDLDFVVEFDALSPGDHKRAYFGLLADLEALLGCAVDLIEAQAVRNPFVRQSIELHLEPVYAAA